MKKTVKTLSILLMTFAMSICFFFAGITFIKADSVTASDVGLEAIPGASIYVGGTVEDTGIKFDMQIAKTGFATLEEQAGEDGVVQLGVEVGRVNSAKEFTALASYVVKTTANEDMVLAEEGDNYTYSFSIKYNLTNVFTNSPYGKYIAEQPEEGSEDYDAYFEQQDYINRMYLDELCVRPFYKTISANAEETLISGEVSEARSMLHVAMAEINAPTQDVYTEDDIAGKYLNGGVQDGSAIEVYSNGTTNLVLDGTVVTYTIGDSGLVVARENGVIDSAVIANYSEGDTFVLYGYTADRQVIKYTATHAGRAPVNTEELEETVVLTADGKLYLNNSAIEEATVQDVLFNGISIYSEGVVDVSAISNKTLGENVALSIIIDGVEYVGEAQYVTKAFENTPESRAEMARLFSAGNATTTDAVGFDSVTVSGYYVLVDNLTFSEYDKDGNVYTDETFSNMNNSEAYSNIFEGTFDGRGYTLNNVIYYHNCQGGMFGVAGDGATIKNVAINGISKIEKSSGVYSVKTTAPYSMLYWKQASADATAYFENVYILGEGNAAYRSAFFYTAAVSETDENDVTTYTFGKLSFNNVIAQNYSFISGVNDAFTTVGEDDVIEDTYFIGNVIGYGSENSTANSSGVNFVRYDSLDAMKDATNDYINFSADYWTVIDGIPVWNTCNSIASLKDSNGAVADLENEITTSGATYTFSYLVNGEDVSNEVVLSVEGSVVSVNGNVITISNDVKGTATVTATYGENAVATYTFTVDTRQVSNFDQEVLLSKYDSKLYFNNTDLEGADIVNVTLNGASIYSNSKVDISSFTNLGSDYTYTLGLETSQGLYELTNVKVYDDVFENTPDSRTRMATLFGSDHAQNAPTYTVYGTSISYKPKKVSGGYTLTGYYALAENLTFDEYNGGSSTILQNEMFGGRLSNTGYAGTNIFDATFDGRGYTLNNVIMDHATGSNYNNYHSGMFAHRKGPNAVLKNFAINGIRFYNASTKVVQDAPVGKYIGLFFYTTTAATTESDTSEISNVYINANFPTGGATEKIALFYSTTSNSLAFKTWNNVIINIVSGDDATATQESALFASTTTIATTKETGVTVSDSYFVINGYISSAQSTIPTAYGTGLKHYLNRAAMAADDENDYTSFENNAYWSIGSDGAPVWNTCSTVAYVKDSNGDDVSLGDTITFAETYTVSLKVNGEAVEEGISLNSNNSDIITTNGNQFTIAEQILGTATVTVTYNEEVVATYEINVNTRTVQNFTQEVLLSKFDGQLYFNNTTLAGKSVAEVTLNGESIYSGSKVDTSSFTDIGSDYAYTLGLETTDSWMYTLTNVKVYDDVFVNTPYSRARMATKFGSDHAQNGATYTVPGTGETLKPYEVASGFYTLTGHFALAENLTFDEYNGAEDRTTILHNEMFGGRTHSSGYAGTYIFDATFDGRGYTLNNVIMDHKTGSNYVNYHTGMFAQIQGPNAVLKNFAINGVRFYNDSTGVVQDTPAGKYTGLFFFQPNEAVNSGTNNSVISNVYVNINMPTGGAVDTIGLFYKAEGLADSTSTLGFKTWSNVVLNFVIGEDSTVAVDESYIFANSNTKVPAEPEAGLSINDVYFVINGGIDSYTDTMPEAYGIKQYLNLAEMAEDVENDYTSFAEAYWTVVEGGVPAWNTLS